MKNLALLISLLVLSNCAMMPGKKNMSEIVFDCESEVDYTGFAFCIKTTYANKGTRPNDVAIHAFYSMIDAINEDYLHKKITNKQARAYTYKALLDTVETSNNAKAASDNSVVCNKIGNTVICN